MMQFIIANKEILSFSAAILGVLLALAFGGILNWRHRICLDYEGRRDVAINILRDRFVQRTCDHYTDVAEERERKKMEVEDIYKRPEQQMLIRELASDLEKQNRVRRLFRWLVLSSEFCFGCIWAAVILILIGVCSIWIQPSNVIMGIWSFFLGLALFGFIVAVSLMLMLDGRFFSLVHKIIEPEGE